MQIESHPLGGAPPGESSLGERLSHPQVKGLLEDCLGSLPHKGLLFFEPPWPALVRLPSGALRPLGRDPGDTLWEDGARKAFIENRRQAIPLPDRHLLALPVQVGERLIGSLCLATRAKAGGQARSLVLALGRALGEMEVRRRLDRSRGQVITREQEARAQAETNERRLAFLHQATGAMLAAPLDTEARLATLAGLCVPDLADWCLVDVLRGGVAHRLEVAHWNPAGAELASRLKGRLERPSAGWGKTELVEDVALLDRSPERGLDVELLRTLGARSAIVLPLQASARPLGSMTFVFAESNRRYDAKDLALIADLGQRAALAVDNARLLQEAETAVRARDETLAIVSHDLRNPLAAILANAGILERRLQGHDADRLLARAESIRRSANRMNHMIRDLLDLARIEAGGLELHPEVQPLGPLLADALEMFQPLAAEKGIELVTQAPTEGPVEPSYDRERILQVLSNLVGNALKFTRSGGSIRVASRVEGRSVAIGVIDDGCGIASDALPHLFDRYWQGRPEERLQGAGLGLYIAKGIVEAHGGRIWALSEPGRGSAFWFTLPLVPGPSTEEQRPAHGPQDDQHQHR